MGGFAQAGGPYLVDQFGRRIGNGPQIGYRSVTRLTPSFSGVSILLASEPIPGSIVISINGAVRIWSVSGNIVTLSAAFTSGNVFVVDYMAATANPGPSVALAFCIQAVMFGNSERGGWWDPSDISTLFQDTAATTPVTAPGQAVACILDKSGNNNHFIQTTSGYRPVYQVDSNGYPYLQFTEANSNYMYQPSTTNPLNLGTTSVSVLYSLKQDSTTTYQYLFARSYLGGSAGRYLTQSNAGTSSLYYDVNGTTNISTNFTFSDTTSPHVCVSTMDRTGITALSYLDGVSTGTQTGSSTNDTATNQLTSFACLLGAYPDTSSTASGFASGYMFDGRLYGLVVRIAAIDAAKNAYTQTALGTGIGLSI